MVPKGPIKEAEGDGDGKAAVGGDAIGLAAFWESRWAEEENGAEEAGAGPDVGERA